MAREVTLPEVLDAREARVARQELLRTKYGYPVISFSMNIPGPVKDTPLIRRAFDWGVKRLDEALSAAGFPVAERMERYEFTGCELQMAVKAEAEAVKALCVGVEESCAMGRLFDMDVIAPAGHKLERARERRCIVCGESGRGCASRRVHSVPELQNAAKALIEEHFAAWDAETIARLCDRALRAEVDATPKPGLVDGRNTGSHRDMDRDTFYKSADALRSYWAECFERGRRWAEKEPETAFAPLREAGLRADSDMLAATGGKNTHKGVIFTLGTVCGAAGRLWSAEAPCRDPYTLCAEAGKLYLPVLAKDQAAFTGATAGERLFLQHGSLGVRGELAAGLPGVKDVALPALRAALREGADENTASVAALLALIARNTDTNMVHRGGAEKARAASEKARLLMEKGPVPDLRAVEALDEEFIAQNLSPGGCADLLAVTLFLWWWREAE